MGTSGLIQFNEPKADELSKAIDDLQNKACRRDLDLR